MILVGDIGGTNTRLALARVENGSVHLQQLHTYSTPSELPPLLRTYLAEASAPPLTAVAVCGAGPVRKDGSIALTNHPCVLDPAAISAAVGVPARVVNDFAAVGHAVPLLSRNDLLACGGGSGDSSAPRIAIGPGTGLGLATVIPAANGAWQVLPGEGGHVDLAPVDEAELAVWQKLRQTHGRVSAELALAGAGLERLAETVGTAPGLTPAGVSQAAAAGDAAALTAVRLWTRWLGRVAGNAALTAGAAGGVYIAGGIVPALGALFSAAVFRSGFEDKEPFSSWLRAVPCWTITHPQPGLLGLAGLAVPSSTELACASAQTTTISAGEPS
jgi:glucokinase